MKNNRVLIVDDEQGFREELTELLKEEFIIETANNGLHGLEKLMTNSFDIVLVDLHMPKMDGLEMLKKMKEKKINIPSIVLTGRGSIEDGVNALNLGASNAFSKSNLDGDKFKRKVNELIKKVIKEKYPYFSSKLKQVEINNFTTFSQTTFELSPHLNIFIGENKTGKTQLLKLLYSTLFAMVETANNQKDSHFSDELTKKLQRIFRPDKLGNLVQFQKIESTIQFSFEDNECNTAFSLNADLYEVQNVKMPNTLITAYPVFLPTREILSIYEKFSEAYERRILKFGEEIKDLCNGLGIPELRHIPPYLIKEIERLEKFMGGKLELDDKLDRFYLITENGQRLEMPLISEGQSKLAMLTRLMLTGALDKNYLFWDEPESNLNPKFIKEIAITILTLATYGVQVFIASHSLFLLREIEICLAKPEFKYLKPRWFGLYKQAKLTNIEQGNEFDDAGDLIALDEELAQVDRYIRGG